MTIEILWHRSRVVLLLALRKIQRIDGGKGVGASIGILKLFPVPSHNWCLKNVNEGSGRELWVLSAGRWGRLELGLSKLQSGSRPREQRSLGAGQQQLPSRLLNSYTRPADIERSALLPGKGGLWAVGCGLWEERRQSH